MVGDTLRPISTSQRSSIKVTVSAGRVRSQMENMTTFTTNRQATSSQRVRRFATRESI
jgi:hypothetical protein